jgi:hypothetical protein
MLIIYDEKKQPNYRFLILKLVKKIFIDVKRLSQNFCLKYRDLFLEIKDGVCLQLMTIMLNPIQSLNLLLIFKLEYYKDIN